MKKLTPLFLLALAGCYYDLYGSRIARGPAEPPVTPGEVQRMAAAGVSQPVLIEVIGKRGATALTADDILAIKQAGASDSVIATMQAVERKEPQEKYVEEPYPSYGPYGYSAWGDFYWGYGYSRCRYGYSTWGGRSCGSGRGGGRCSR